MSVSEASIQIVKKAPKLNLAVRRRTLQYDHLTVLLTYVELINTQYLINLFINGDYSLLVGV